MLSQLSPSPVGDNNDFGGDDNDNAGPGSSPPHTSNPQGGGTGASSSSVGFLGAGGHCPFASFGPLAGSVTSRWYNNWIV
jgi:hypothetical protein